MPAAVESVGSLKARVRAGLLSESLQLSNPDQDAEEVPSGVLKITQRAMGKRSYRSIKQSVLVCPCLCPSLTHHSSFNLVRQNKKTYVFL